ncbi:hypothetical protein GF1_32370 [Desulfolithobacter dissulfuricans]|uniref:Uncharacterized protein n=1 Tax=Desulfolithobacter dissulfuricans TaxID=2795293 RepID=A0A915U3W0_9BACT|nr:hypothetical protein GF1_32370 [Desulfolithobacter dissulfuricans]
MGQDPALQGLDGDQDDGRSGLFLQLVEGGQPQGHSGRVRGERGVGRNLEAGIDQDRQSGEQADILGQRFKLFVRGDDTAYTSAQSGRGPGKKKGCTTTVQPADVGSFPVGQ